MNLFRAVQGVGRPVAPAPMPMSVRSIPAPMYEEPFFMDGGFPSYMDTNAAYAYGGYPRRRRRNVPGYHDGGYPHAHPHQPVPGAAGTPSADAGLTEEDVYNIHQQELPGRRNLVYATGPDGLQVIDAYNIRDADGSGSGADNSHVYAQIAEEARQFNEQLAFQREQERSAQTLNKYQAQVAREQMMQDWYRQQAQDQLARRAMANDAANSAMNAFTANVGSANIPGIENWRPHTQPGGADPSTNAPVLRLNPSLAMGHQASRPANIPAPSVGDLVY